MAAARARGARVRKDVQVQFLSCALRANVLVVLDGCLISSKSEFDSQFAHYLGISLMYTNVYFLPARLTSLR